MLNKLLSDLDWALKVAILAFVGTFALAEITSAEEGWSKGTDSYYYKNGDSSAPYEREEYTVNEARKVKYCDAYGCCYWKTVYYPIKKYKYNRVYKITDKTSIDEIALHFAGIKGKEVASELRVREDYAKVQRIGELAEVFNLDKYQLQSFGQNLNYGDPYFQYGPQTGNTQYATKEFAADYYGEAQLTLVDVNRTIAMQHELQKAQRDYGHEADLQWQAHTEAIVDAQGDRTSILAQMQQQNETIALLGGTLKALIREAKPEPQGTVRVRESHGELAERGTRGEAFSGKAWEDDDFVALVENSCAACHEKHAKVDSELFPNGVDLANVASFNDDQLERAWFLVGTGKMPPPDNSLNVPALSKGDKRGAVNYLVRLQKE